MKTTKKVLAIVLSVMLLLSVMPFAAFAADANLSEILAGAEAKYVEITDTNIVVDADTTLTGHILDLYGTVTLDLAGHNLIAGATNSSGQEVAIWINPGANVTITDSAQPSTAASYSSSTGALTVNSGVAAISSTYYGIINEGNLTLGKAVVKGDNNAICLTAGSTLTTTQANSIICGGTYGVTYPGGTATLNLNKGMIYGQYGLSGNSSWDSDNNCYKFGGNTINIGTAKIYGKGIDDENNGIVNGAAIVLGADDDCNITGSAQIIGYDAPAIVVRASADLDVTGNATVTTNGDLSSVKVLDGSTAVPCAPVAVDTACGYTKADNIDVDLANGNYSSNVTDVPAVAFEGKSGDEAADYIAVSGGKFTENGSAADVSEYIDAAADKVVDANGKVVDALFEVNGVKYAHITEAVAAVPADGTQTTIKLLKDVSDSGYGGAVVQAGQNIIFDLDNHTWTLRGTVGSTGTKTNGFQFLQGSTVKIKDGTITAKLASIYTVIQNYGDLTIENATVQYTSSGANKTAVSTNSGNVIIKNSTITGPASTSSFQNQALSVTPGWGGYTATSIVVEDTTINGDVRVDAQAEGSTADVEFTGTTNMTRGEIKLSDTANGTLDVKNTGTGITAPEGYKWGEDGILTELQDTTVAVVGSTEYATLEAAIASISTVTSATHSKSVDGDKTTPYYTYVANGEVKLVKDANGNGIMIGSGSDLTIDFNGKTYTIDGRMVGSNGTETNGFNFAKNSDITLKNGTLTSEKTKILVQNYADLTVDNMTLTNANVNEGKFYTLSNNFGDIVITDSVINASENGTSYAFDISTGWASAYADGVTVTMNGTTTINGNIEVGSYANYPGTATVALHLTSGTINGEIVASAYDTSWAKVSDDIGDNIVVTKSDECSYAAPEGYKWVSNGDGTSSLEKVEDAKNGANLILEGTIEEAVYLDANSYDLENDAYVKVTANANLDVSETPSVVSTNYNVDSLTPYVNPDDANDPYNGTYKFAFKNAPAQATEEVKVELFASADAETPVKTITYSVKDYCDNVIATSNDAKLVALCKSILDYAAAAQVEFDYNTDNMAVDEFYNAAAIDALTYSDITDTYLDGNLDIRGCAFQCLSTTNINLYLNAPLTSKEMEASVAGDEDSAIKANYMRSEQNGLFISVNGIEAGNMNKNFTVLTSNGYITTNTNTIVKTCLYYGVSTTLAKTIYFYAAAADAYFN